MKYHPQSRGPLHTTHPIELRETTILDTRKMEAKQLYFGWWKRYDKTRINEPCLVLWSKELHRNILIRGNESVGKLFGQILYGENMDEDFVLESMIGEDSLDWFMLNLRTILENNDEAHSFEAVFSLVGGGPHPTTPSLWFNGYEIADILVTGE